MRPEVFVESGEPELEVSEVVLPELGEDCEAGGENVARSQHQKEKRQNRDGPGTSLPENGKKKH